MNIQGVKNFIDNAMRNRETAALSSLFPDEFEYYALSLELVDADGNVVDNLIFPVNPSSISYQYRPLLNIKKTSNAVSVLFNQSFQPFTISLAGCFGKKLRILLGRDEMNGFAFKLQFKNTKEYNVEIKTGYGVTKVLKQILENSLKTDSENRPFRLFFHNPAFNTSNLVEVNSFTFNISEQKNRMWDYNINLTAVAPASIIRDSSEQKSSLMNVTKLDFLQQTSNSIISRINGLS